MALLSEDAVISLAEVLRYHPEAEVVSVVDHGQYMTLTRAQAQQYLETYAPDYA